MVAIRVRILPRDFWSSLHLLFKIERAEAVPATVVVADHWLVCYSIMVSKLWAALEVYW